MFYPYLSITVRLLFSHFVTTQQNLHFFWKFLHQNFIVLVMSSPHLFYNNLFICLFRFHTNFLHICCQIFSPCQQVASSTNMMSFILAANTSKSRTVTKHLFSVFSFILKINVKTGNACDLESILNFTHVQKSAFKAEERLSAWSMVHTQEVSKSDCHCL